MSERQPRRLVLAICHLLSAIGYSVRDRLARAPCRPNPVRSEGSIVLFVSLALSAGCVGRAAGKVAVKTVSVAGSATAATTGAVVKTSGKVVAKTGKLAVQTSGSVVSSIAQAGLVTFKDTATGVAKQIPYTEGLRLYAASQTAKVNLGMSAFEVVRDGVAVLKSNGASIKPGAAGDVLLKPSDVVHVRRLASQKPAAKQAPMHYSGMP